MPEERLHVVPLSRTDGQAAEGCHRHCTVQAVRGRDELLQAPQLAVRTRASRCLMWLWH